jgi:hypothetical protein
MSHAKQASKRKSRTKAVTVLAVAGALSLAAGASLTAIGPASHTPMANRTPVITLGEEQISDVRVATFYIFDKENAGRHAPGLQLVKERRHRGTGGSARGGYGGWRRSHRRRRARRYVGRYWEAETRLRPTQSGER